MNKRLIVAAVALITLAALGIWISRVISGEDAPTYRFATVERGNLDAAVSATGSLGAVTTVQVGTQVSGKIVATLADFNDRVKKGQLIARIDPVLQQQAVRDAQAGLERARAEADKAQFEYERNRELFERKIITEIDFNAVKYANAVARANVKAALVALDRAEQNLTYTSIYAPIDGVVVERNVDVGQTVAASMSTPQLFLIANDLAHMQILAAVDESDIGQVRLDQPVRFTVQAYPDERFQGAVKQIRLQSKTAENVVNYTVVVGVDNPQGRLLPGMTATLEFLTGSVTNVLKVPNAALRFRPPQQLLAQLRERRASASDARAEGVGPNGRAERSEGRERGARSEGASRIGRLWYLDAEGDLQVARVRAGITDGQMTQIEGADVSDGMQVIVGVVQAEQAESTNPFQPTPQRSVGSPQRPGF